LKARPSLGAVAVAALLLAARAPTRGDGAVDFARDVQPLFEQRCFQCHAGDKPKSGFRLDARKRALRGGNSGDLAIVAGHPEQSRLIQLVSAAGGEGGLVMPPKGERLSAAQVATLTKWIADGAPWPDALAGDELVHEHWSFVKPAVPPLPDVSKSPHASWPRNEIDRFTLPRMESEGLAPSPLADRATLARRVSLDLIGLPPPPSELDAYVHDRASDDDAYARLVDRLLASPHFGERWARVWLDLARYADSAGYGSDPLRPFLWRWRDWVIDAFNSDKRYDEFTVEQLAGDLLPNPTNDQLLATAFHRNTMTNTEGGTDDEEFRVAAVKDRVDSTMQVWMGLTVGCAKCHSHKFDPIPQKDYYRLFAIFNQTEDADRADEEPRVATPTPEQAKRLDELQAKRADVEKRRDAAAADLAASEQQWEHDLAQQQKRWVVLHPTNARSVAGADVAIGADGSVLLSGACSAIDRYVVDADVELDGVTAIRLEALPDDSLPGHGPGRASNGNFVLNDLRVIATPHAPAPKSARFVRIENPGRKKILSLAEVEVTSGGQNVARAAKATQSSTDFGGAPELAIDGNESGHYFDAKSTSHTRVEDDPWWELDLGANVPVERVTIWNRTDGNLQFRLAGARVSLLGAQRELLWQTVLVDAPNPSVELDPSGSSTASLVRASADFEQERFFVAGAIDDDANGPQSGWAVGPNTGRAHVAVFETAAPLPTRGGAKLRFKLAHSFGQEHTLGKFRLSVCAGASPPLPQPARIAELLAKESGVRSDAERRELAAYYRDVAPELARFNEEAKPIDEALAQLDREVVRTPVMREVAPEKRRKSHVLIKSNFLALGDEVEPALPRAFAPATTSAPPPDRLALAKWIVSSDNPLTARVAVNRFWAQLFGRGLVETEEDFGTQGTPPSHPELLDWLATRFVASGWDVKALLRTIVLSATYRQSSRIDAAALAKDPRDFWLARFPRRRLEAEMVRDAALAASGLLSPKLHGPSVYPPQPDDLWQAAFNDQHTYPTSTGEERWRRGLYSFWRRTVPPPSMQTFDAPSREFCTMRRQTTDTPLQALVTLNDPCFVEAAQAMARRLVKEGGATTSDRCAYALKVALCRAPRDGEVALLEKLWTNERERMSGDVAAARTLSEQPLGPLPAGADPVEMAAWTTVANVVLNLDGFLTKD
jgi:mono/diheme cytochrome c family protein